MYANDRVPFHIFTFWGARALASHQCGPGSNPGVNMWVEFVVGSLLCSERFFSAYSGFPLSPKTNTSKFQFDLERTDTEKRALELLGASWVNKLQLHFYISHPIQRVKGAYKLQSAQNYFFINYAN